LNAKSKTFEHASDLDGYGANPVVLAYCGLRDRLQGRAHRARARWGHLRAPEGAGKLIWVRAGSSRRSVRLAAEVVAALREKRRDVRLILTYHAEYPDLLAARLGGLAKTGFGYGPADAPRAVNRVLARLEPLGVICVEDAPGHNFLRALASRKIHAVQLQGACPQRSGLDAYYPYAEGAVVEGAAGYVAPAADLLTLIIPSQVDPVFGSLMKGNGCTDMWWAHAPKNGLDWLRTWAGSPLYSNSVLCVSEPESGFAEAAVAAGLAVFKASSWSRDAVPAGSIWIVDEERWLPALAASASGVWLGLTGDRETYWQALAGGAPRVAAEASAAADVMVGWLALQSDPAQARKRRDESRRLFWEERRKAAAVLEEFLQRVYDW